MSRYLHNFHVMTSIRSNIADHRSIQSHTRELQVTI